MDCITLNGLKVNCLIGTFPDERLGTQELHFDLKLYGDFSKAGKSDRLEDTVDYCAVERSVQSYVSQSSFCLLEALGYAVAEKILNEFPLLDEVSVRIEKPYARILSNGVSLEITRKR